MQIADITRLKPLDEWGGGEAAIFALTADEEERAALIEQFIAPSELPAETPEQETARLAGLERMRVSMLKQRTFEQAVKERAPERGLSWVMPVTLVAAIITAIFLGGYLT